MKKEKEKRRHRICKFRYERMKIYDIPNFNPLLDDTSTPLPLLNKQKLLLHDVT